MFEKQNYRVLGTSSLAIANSLGYEDGENMSFEELFEVVKAIIQKVSIPLSVDLEAGYGNDIDTIIKNIIKNIISLIDIGVVGINIEDSIIENNNRIIVDANKFAQTIKSIKSYLIKNKINIFLNIRTDFYIMGLTNPLEETLKRIKIYENVGADGIFVPCIVDVQDIKEVVKSTSLPVNIMTMPNLPSFDTLEKIGIKRVSQGPFIYNDMIKKLENTIKNIKDNNSFKGLFK